jgi:hypothetical protein
MNLSSKYLIVAFIGVFAAGFFAGFYLKNSQPSPSITPSGSTPAQNQIQAKFSSFVSLLKVFDRQLTVSTIPPNPAINWYVNVDNNTQITKNGKSINLGDLKQGNSLNVYTDGDLSVQKMATAVKIDVIQ